MPNNSISWLAFIFFVVGAVGGCLHLYEVVRIGVLARRRNFNPVPHNPAPMAGRPGRAVMIEPKEEPKIEDKKEVSDG